MRRKRGSPPLCPDCGETNIEKFYLNKKGNTTTARCKECQKKKINIDWHNKTKAEKQATRARRYGIEPNEYMSLVKKQNGRCAICGNKPETKRGLHLDHNHETGEIRELLCHYCNTAIGSFHEDIEVMQKAINYLKKYQINKDNLNGG